MLWAIPRDIRLTRRDAATPVDWRYGLCTLETEPRRFGPFAGLVANWRRRIAPAARLPRRSALEFEDFAGWFGRIFIARVERQPFNLRFTLWGTQLVDWWGVDYTGKTLGQESLDPELWKEGELRYFEAMDSAPFVGLAWGYLSQHRRSHIKVLGLDLPCSDGERLDHVVSAHVEIAMEETAQTLLPDCPITPFFELDRADGGGAEGAPEQDGGR